MTQITSDPASKSSVDEIHIMTANSKRESANKTKRVLAKRNELREIKSLPRTHQRGRWGKDEHKRFIDAIEAHGKQWKKIAAAVGSRTVIQIRTHAQKYFMKLAKDKNATMCGFKVSPFDKSSPSRKEATSIISSQAPPKKRRRKAAKPTITNMSKFAEGNSDIVDWQLSPSSVVQDMNFDLDFHTPHSAANLFVDNDCGSSTSSSSTDDIWEDPIFGAPVTVDQASSISIFPGLDADDDGLFSNEQNNWGLLDDIGI